MLWFAALRPWPGSRPAPVLLSGRCLTNLRCAGLQRVISSFTYNLDHRSEPHYDTDKTRPYAAIMVRLHHLLSALS